MAEARRVIGADGDWDRVWRRWLFAWEEESVRECSVFLHNIVLQENVHDAWCWLLDPIQDYSVMGAYRLLTTSRQPVDRTMVDYVWQKNIPSKVSLFVWRLLRNRLSTKDNLMRHALHHTDMTCISGCGDSEMATHLFLHCDIFNSL